MMDGEYRIFLRESTGLVKEVGFWDAVSINVANMSIGTALATIGFTLAVLPTVAGANLVYASLIAALFSLPQVIVYSILIRYIPRVGGDYVWLGRALGPRLAWLTSGLVLGFIIQDLAYYALVAIAAVFQLESVLPILGIHITINTWLSIVIASAFFTVIVLANILGTKYGIKLMMVLTTVSIIGLITAITIFFITPRVQAINAISSLLPAGYAYSRITNDYAGPTLSIDTILMLLPFFAIYVYPWLNAGPAISAEIKGKKAINWNIPIAFILTLALLTLGFEAMYYSLGFKFVTAALSNPNLNGIINFWTMAMAISSNYVLKWLIGISSITWYLSLLTYGAIIPIRYWFALAFDRVWPSAFAHLSPRFGTPIYAHIFDLAITTILIVLTGIFYGIFTALYGATIGALIYFLAIGVAALMMSLRDSFNMSGLIRLILSVSGVLQTVIMAYLMYQFIEYPGIWGGNWLAYGVVIGSIFLGIITFLLSRYINKRRYGIDISVVYTEIPPE